MHCVVCGWVRRRREPSRCPALMMVGMHRAHRTARHSRTTCLAHSPKETKDSHMFIVSVVAWYLAWARWYFGV